MSSVVSQPRWAMVAVGVYLAALLALFLHFPPSPDDAVYDYIGWVVANGGTTYVDAADQNFPGMVFLHALPTRLLGNTLRSYRALDILLLLATTALMAGYLRRYVGSLAAFAIWPMYPTIYAAQNRWLVGQRDIVVFPLLLGAAWSQLRRIEGGSALWCVAQGSLLAGATLLRPTFLAMAALLAFADLLWRPAGRRVTDSLRDQTLVAVTAVAMLALAALGGHLAGALGEWWNVAVLFNLGVYSTNPPSLDMFTSTLELLRYWGWLIAVAAFGVWLTWRHSRRATVYLGAIFATTWISFFVQRKGFGYHLGCLYPLIAIFAAPSVALAFSTLRERTRASRTQFLAAAVVLLLVTGGLARKVSRNLWPEILWLAGQASEQELLASADTGEEGFTLAHAVELAGYVRTRVPSDGHFLLWGRPSVVNYLAERWSPTRFTSFALLAAPRADFPLFGAWRQEFADALERTRPQLICLIRDPSGTGYAYLPEPIADEPRIGDVLARKLQAAYTFDRSFGSADCFRAHGRETVRHHDD